MIDLSKYNYIQDDVVSRFLKYVQIDTTSDEEGSPNPTTTCQWDLANILVTELEDLGLLNAHVDENCFVYAVLPASDRVKSEPITFLSHLDTSPAVSGHNVKPLMRKSYQGEDLAYPYNDDLILSPTDCPKLLDYIGDHIITSSGDTLLGADDKAGIAEIMTSLRVLQSNPDILHPEIRVCFTPDEEVGAGTANINRLKLGRIAYTIDGGEIGELEDECFDAHSVKIQFKGHNVHPGKAKNIMINACKIAAEFISLLPSCESPENTENREGFYHVRSIKGDETIARVDLLLRDFLESNNEKRVELIETLAEFLRVKYDGLAIEIDHSHTYQNMKTVLDKYPQVIGKAEKVMLDLGINPLRRPIRGGTDGAKLCYLGIPTPNIFTGGFLYHSLKEWIPVSSMVKAVEVIVNLANSWAE
jgi:tripeptide aminopeptidase